MQKNGRAVVYDAPNAPFVVREFPVRDVHPDEVLVRITMSTICRSDIHSYQGHRPNPCPGILGHEIVGVIEQLGAEREVDLRGDKLAVGEAYGRWVRVPAESRRPEKTRLEGRARAARFAHCAVQGNAGSNGQPYSRVTTRTASQHNHAISLPAAPCLVKQARAMAAHPPQ